MARVYRFLLGTTEQGVFRFGPESTGKGLEAAFPYCARASSHYAREAFEAAQALADEREDEPLEYEYLFFLARRLMAATRAEFRRTDDMARKLAPYAIVYLEALTLLGRAPQGGQLLDWEDDEQVLEYFEAIYGKTKFAADERLPEFVMNQAKAHPLRIKGMPSRRLALLSFAYHLQRMQGDTDIFLPVETLGRLLDCSPTFVSQLLANARTGGYLTSRGNYIKNVAARPYRFEFPKLGKTELPKGK